MYEVFATFPLDQIGWLSLDTLYSLCQPKYKELLERMRCSRVWWDTQVQDLMKQVRSCLKQTKPTLEPQPASGWKRMPSGGGRYYAVNLHNDKLGVLIEQYVEKKNWLPAKVIEEAVLSLCQLQPLDDFLMRDYKFGARTLKDCANNWEILKSQRGGG